MTTLRAATGRLGETLFLLGSVLAVLLPVSPWNMPLVGRDSGVFLYAGWRILAGELPYRDVWDHKPPIIYYIDAVGLALGGGSRWGVWLLEFLSLLVAASLGFYLFKRLFGLWAAIFSTVLWLITLVNVLQGGNLTTEYTLPLQFLALWLVVDADDPRFPRWRWVVIGVLGGLAFFTKQSAIGLWIAIALYLTLTRWRSRQLALWLREITGLSSGVLVVGGLVVGALALQGALEEFWHAAFRYNLDYLGVPLGFQLQVMVAGIAPLAQTGLWQIALFGGVLGLAYLRYQQSLSPDWRPLLLVALLALPLEMVLASLGGRGYPHYYMALLPTLCVLSAVAFKVVWEPLFNLEMLDGMRVVLLSAALGLLMAGSAAMYREVLITNAGFGNPEVLAYIETHTEPDDSVLMWGAETSVNFHARRRSPTRYVYQFPLYRPRYVTEAMILEFLDDVRQGQPRLLIDTRHEFTPLYDFPIESEPIQERVDRLAARYRPVEEVGGWMVYELIDDRATTNRVR